MTRETGPFIAWPGWPHFRFTTLLLAGNAAWFTIVYGGCDWVTAHRSLRLSAYLPIELNIPFIPGTVAIYMSIYLLVIAGPFILRSRPAFVALIHALALSTLLAGICFLLLPTAPPLAPRVEEGFWVGLFHFADGLNLTYNTLPSLHVALSVCCVAAYVQHSSALGRAFLWAWALAIALSTLLTHQHYVADVLSGWLLGILSFRWALAQSPSIVRWSFSNGPDSLA